VGVGVGASVELGATASSSTTADGTAVDTSGGRVDAVGVVEVADVALVGPGVVRAVVAGCANDVGVRSGPSREALERGICQRASRTSRITSSTATTARPTVLPDTPWDALGWRAGSLLSMRHSYPTRAAPEQGCSAVRAPLVDGRTVRAAGNGGGKR
jgi:hypothetical protein